MRALIVTVGVVLLIVGVALGTVSSSATSYGGGSYSCGSPWFTDSHSINSQQTSNGIASVLTHGGLPVVDAAAPCAEAFGSRGVFGGVLAALGALALLGAALVAMARQGKPRDPGPTPPPTAAL